MMEKCVQYQENCSGCGACADICPKGAISLTFDRRGLLYPTVDKEKCIQCGACVTVCPCDQTKDYPGVSKTFIAAGRDKDLYIKSSSGSIFAHMAKAVLSRGGAVYGAAMLKKGENLECRHIRIDTTQELYKIQGSKYVHSRTDGLFPEIRDTLESGKPVLFSGTSCQLAALKTYLKKEYDNLFSVDLVCHGVPEISGLQEYIRYLERRNHCKVNNISFRRKTTDKTENNSDSFVITLTCEDPETGKPFSQLITKDKSAYYMLFLRRANYRPNCYACQYASVHKPGDVTLGDFKPTASEIEQLGLDKNTTYSSVFVRTSKGNQLLEMIDDSCEKHEIASEALLKHHKNMNSPSRITSAGKRYRQIYNLFGYKGLDMILDLKKRLIAHRK